MILSALVRHLAGKRGLVDLKIISGEPVGGLGPNHRNQQLRGGQHVPIEGLTAQIDAVVLEEAGALTIDRGVLLKFGGQDFDDELVGKFALGKDLAGSRSDCGRRDESAFCGNTRRRPGQNEIRFSQTASSGMDVGLP